MPVLRQMLEPLIADRSCNDSIPTDLLDVPVVATTFATGAPCASHAELFASWPGGERFVKQWFVLANGTAVGVNEPPDGPATFPVIEYRS